MDGAPESVLRLLRERGLRTTPQRRAIVSEVVASPGHINATEVARRVQERIPGVNVSTVYRTLDLLEDLGVVAHAHGESGPEYHLRSESDHVHLTCADCGSDDELSLSEAEELRGLISRNHGFEPDLSHFAISGLCGDCREP